jgi:hypothetical protein
MKKYKYHCPVDGCSETATSGAGMSAHLRSTHSDIWAGNTQKTLEALGKETIQVDVTENGMTSSTSQKPRSSLTRKDGTTRKPKVVRRKKTRRHRRTTGQRGRYLQRAANEEPEIGSINNCPHCGKKIRHFLLAAGFQEGDGT